MSINKANHEQLRYASAMAQSSLLATVNPAMHAKLHARIESEKAIDTAAAPQFNSNYGPRVSTKVGDLTSGSGVDRFTKNYKNRNSFVAGSVVYVALQNNHSCRQMYTNYYGGPNSKPIAVDKPLDQPTWSAMRAAYESDDNVNYVTSSLVSRYGDSLHLGQPVLVPLGDAFENSLKVMAAGRERKEGSSSCRSSKAGRRLLPVLPECDALADGELADGGELAELIVSGELAELLQAAHAGAPAGAPADASVGGMPPGYAHASTATPPDLAPDGACARSGNADTMLVDLQRATAPRSGGTTSFSLSSFGAFRGGLAGSGRACGSVRLDDSLDGLLQEGGMEELLGAAFNEPTLGAAYNNSNEPTLLHVLAEDGADVLEMEPLRPRSAAGARSTASSPRVSTPSAAFQLGVAFGAMASAEKVAEKVAERVSSAARESAKEGAAEGAASATRAAACVLDLRFNAQHARNEEQHERTRSVVRGQHVATRAANEQQHVATRAANVQQHERTVGTIAQSLCGVHSKLEDARLDAQETAAKQAVAAAAAQQAAAAAQIAEVVRQREERDAQRQRDELLSGAATDIAGMRGSMDAVVPQVKEALDERVGPDADRLKASLAHEKSQNAALRAQDRGATAALSHQSRMRISKRANDGAGFSTADAKRPAGAKTAAGANTAAGSPHSRGRAL
jgi:hypothetical protein